MRVVRLPAGTGLVLGDLPGEVSGQLIHHPAELESCREGGGQGLVAVESA